MRITVVCDHAGVTLAETLKKEVVKIGFELVPVARDIAFDDYPDTAEAMAQIIMNGEADRGILVCGSGVGVAVAANKFPGIRAAVCHDSYSAHQGVEHDRMNVLCLGARIVGEELAKEIAGNFLRAQPSDEERHVRRSNKIDAIEKKYFKGK